jgi:hypothetical protein
MTTPTYVTVKEWAADKSVTPQHVYDLISRGDFADDDVIRIGRAVRIRPDARPRVQS